MKYASRDLERLHQELYRILAEIIRVCELLDIPYFIQGGSAIGALYNCGIVPWDDDIDVGMVRSDYERFLREAPAHLAPEYFLEWFGTESNTPFYFAKVKRNDTLFVEEIWRKMDIHHGIFVDIFPYDRIPDNALLEKAHRAESKFWINCFMAKEVWLWRHCGKCDIDEPLPKSWLSCAMIRCVVSLLSRTSIYNIMNRVLGRYNRWQTKMVNIVRMPKDQIVRADIENSVTMEFGGMEVKAPRNIETYLRHHYPNLRPVLPEEEQVNHAPYALSFGSDDIFHLEDEAAFEREALQLFRYQSVACKPYAEYLRLIGVEPRRVRTLAEIPMLPIELFKSHEVYCATTPPQKLFTSSATTGMTSSRHLVADLSLYERAFEQAFRAFYGEPSKWSIYGLLPSYLEREGSSLVYMVDRLISKCGSGGFYLDNYEQLLADMANDPKPKILLGVTYALLDLAERYAPKLSNTVIMETGGMKGRRKELPKGELHRILCEAFGVEHIHSEYGMAELLSQAYSSGEGVFRAPQWMRVLVRDVNNPFSRLADGRRGAIDIIDLANRSSCAFIATQDVGVRYADGSFRIEGRVEESDVRGCNLLVQ